MSFFNFSCKFNKEGGKKINFSKVNLAVFFFFKANLQNMVNNTNVHCKMILYRKLLLKFSHTVQLWSFFFFFLIFGDLFFFFLVFVRQVSTKRTSQCFLYIACGCSTVNLVTGTLVLVMDRPMCFFSVHTTLKTIACNKALSFGYWRAGFKTWNISRFLFLFSYTSMMLA